MANVERKIEKLSDQEAVGPADVNIARMDVTNEVERTINNYNLYSTGKLGITVTQPLLRGFGIDGFRRLSEQERPAVAVGTIIADRPPLRSVRARLRIRLLPRMAGVKALHRIRMENASDWNPSVCEPVEPVHGDPAALAAAR
jgi:hypothetical protein